MKSNSTKAMEGVGMQMIHGGVETGLDAARNDGWSVVAMETATDSLS
jgi:hypothetical protein